MNDLTEVLTGLSTTQISIMHNLEHKNGLEMLKTAATKDVDLNLVETLVQYNQFGGVASLVGDILIPTEDNVMSLWLRRFGVWEANESWIMSSFFKDKTVLNFGSSIGWYLLLSGKHQSKKIIGIDANPLACAVAHFNCKVNSLANVEIHNAAVATENSFFSIKVEENNFGNSYLQHDRKGNFKGESPAIFLRHYKPEIVISDIQGFDPLVHEAFQKYERANKLLMLENDPSAQMIKKIALNSDQANYELSDGCLRKITKRSGISDTASTLFIATGNYEAKLNRIVKEFGSNIPKYGNLNDIAQVY